MKTPYTLIAIILLTIALLGCFGFIQKQKVEIERVTTNQNNLLQNIEVLTLQKNELESGFKSQEKIIYSLGIRLNRVIFTTQTVTVTKETIKTVFKDSITVKNDTLKCMQFATPHLTISGCLDKTNHFEGFYQSVDTITQIIHKVPKFKLLGIQFGTKGIKQEVVSSNPNSTIVYQNYIVLKK